MLSEVGLPSHSFMFVSHLETVYNKEDTNHLSSDAMKDPYLNFQLFKVKSKMRACHVGGGQLAK